MKYPCIVCRFGKWYQAGEEVPDENPTEKATSTTEKVVEEPIKAESKPKYTKQQINKMKNDEVKALAKALGFEPEQVGELSGTEVKRSVIEFLKL